jgi:predicted ATP-dependent serine protease
MSRITDIDYQKNLEIFHSTRIEDIISTAEINKYDIIIIDSIQTVYFQGSDSPF